MKQNELKFIKNIYDYGCYFLDLLFIGRGYIEPTLTEMADYYKVFTTKGWMDEECFIKNPTAILEYLTGEEFDIKKDVVLDSSAFHIIGRYYNPSTNLHHFVVMGNSNRVRWDSIQDSNTVKNGLIESYRLFYKRKK